MGKSPYSAVTEQSNGLAEIAEHPHSAAWIPAGISVAVLALFCVAATHDYMEWNRIRWNMGRCSKQGVDPLAIVGGFEFNAWNNYDTFVARGNITNVNRWWYDGRDYIISMTSPGRLWNPAEQGIFFLGEFRPVNLYVLRLIPDSKFQIPN